MSHLSAHHGERGSRVLYLPPKVVNLPNVLHAHEVNAHGGDGQTCELHPIKWLTISLVIPVCYRLKIVFM